MLGELAGQGTIPDDFDAPLPDDVLEAFEGADALAARAGFTELSITARVAAGVAELPPYYRDPFDRMLIAQAAAEQVPLCTSDNQIQLHSGLVELRP